MKSIVVMSYKKLPQSELATFTNNVVLRMTTNPIFASLSAPVAELKIQLVRFQESLSQAVNGGKVNTLHKDTCKAAMLDQLDSVARQLDVLSNEVEAVVLAAGFEVRKTPVAITEIAAPTGLIANDIKGRTGEVYLTWSPVPGSAIFGIQRRKKGDEIWQNGDYSTASNITLKGLPSGATMEFQVVTKATKGISSDWSQTVEVLVS